MVKLTDILIGVIIVSMAALGMTSFLYEQSVNNGVTGVDMGFNNTFNHLSSMTNTTEDVKQSIETTSLTDIDGFSALFSGAFKILRLVLTSAFLPISIMTDIGTSIGLPYWFSTGITAILILLIAFAIANITFGRGKA